jgi:hypothetical protein
MLENLAGKDRFVWLFSALAALCCAAALFPLTVSSSDLCAILYVFVTIPLVSLVLLVIAYRRRERQRLNALTAFALFLVFTAALFARFAEMRDAARWFVYGRAFKADLLTQADTAGGQLKHIEWEGWGFPGAGDTAVYVVFDPTDSLASASKTRKSGKFNGLPCDVYRVRRLENKWYAVQFYTDTDWKHCG